MNKPLPSLEVALQDPVVLERLRLSLKYEPAQHALNAIVERLIYGETPLRQEIEDGMKALATAGFRTNWQKRDFLPGVYGYRDENGDET